MSSCCGHGLEDHGDRAIVPCAGTTRVGYTDDGRQIIWYHHFNPEGLRKPGWEHCECEGYRQ